ncbi:MAG: amidase family protein, partial [Cypionkella sp.]
MSANTWTIAAARDALRKGEISATDLTMACLTAMDAGDGLNAFVHKTPELALEQARAAEVRLKAGEAPAMCGIPVGVKDLFCVKGVPTQAGSNILAGFKPEYDSTV